MPRLVENDGGEMIQNVTIGDLVTSLQALIDLHGPEIPVYIYDADTDWIMAVSEIPEYSNQYGGWIVKSAG